MLFSELTTMRVGGPAERLVVAGDASTLVDTALEAWGSGEELLVLGGGSNLVVGDDGFDGVTLQVATRGIERLEDTEGTGVHVRVEAGESWDALVAHTVDNGWSGLEALSGIPGSVGAAPIQNIGAYGQEVSDTLVSVDFLDYLSGDFLRLPAADLELGYRTSAIKHGRAGVVVAVELRLTDDGALGAPVRYAQLASALGVQLGERVPVAAVRDAVLRLRSSKGMVLDASDPDSVSAGSFFTNPLVSAGFARGLPADAPRFPVEPEPVDRVVPLGSPAAPPPVVEDDRVKLSAAWLIERAGVGRGFRLPGSRAAISSKHTLAITNTGGASAVEIAELARYVQTRVFSEFGVQLAPEPNLVGLTL